MLPATPLVGGVTQPNAWGANPWGGNRSLRGAVFLNERTHDEGAVGCFMQGPLKVTATGTEHKANEHNQVLQSMLNKLTSMLCVTAHYLELLCTDCPNL